MNFKRLLATTAVVGVIASGAVAGPAFADSVHLKGGANAAPTFTDNGLTLSAAGALSGLGNQDLQVGMTATGNPRAVCVNPSVKNGKDNEPPGQNPAPVTLTANPESIPASKIKNGNVDFGLTTNPPTNNPIAGAPDCPNHQWNEVIKDIAFTSATITVQQPVGTTVLTVSCTFNPPTSNGTVPAGTVSCTSS